MKKYVVAPSRFQVLALKTHSFLEWSKILSLQALGIFTKYLDFCQVPGFSPSTGQPLMNCVAIHQVPGFSPSAG